MVTARSTGSRRAQPVVALRFDGEALWVLDQTTLPWREDELRLRNASEVAEAIGRLRVRGAPLIGVAAGYGVALELAQDPSLDRFERAYRVLRDARPTAVNLARAVDRVRAAALADATGDPAGAALREACEIEAEELAASDAIAERGAALLSDARRVLTHCNTGALA